MPNDINELDEQDVGLKMVMGDRFIDATEDSPVVVENDSNSPNIPDAPKAAHKPTSKPMDAQWQPVKQRNWMDDMKDCVKSTLLFGGLNMLIWYWQIMGLMDESIAMPCMLVCAAMAGIGIGKVLRKK